MRGEIRILTTVFAMVSALVFILVAQVDSIFSLAGHPEGWS